MKRSRNNRRPGHIWAGSKKLKETGKPGRGGRKFIEYAPAAAVAAAGIILTVILAAGQQNGGDRTVTAVSRPSFGGTKEYSLQVNGQNGSQNITFEISGKEPSGEEADEVFDAAWEAEIPVILGGNKSADCVTENLTFPEKTDSGIGLAYISLTPDLLSNYGYLEAAEIPEEGSEMQLMVTLSLGSFKKSYVLVMTRAAAENRLSEEEQLQELLQKADAENREEETVVLPTELNGRKLRFSENTVSPWIPALFALAAAALILFLPRQNAKNEAEKKREALERAYPELLIRLCMLVGAGLSIRGAFERIASEYRAEKQKKPGWRNEACEEVVLMTAELANGLTEAEAYLRFGRRTGIHAYVRLGNLLSENLRQGISGLDLRLRTEISDALEERKNRAVRKGGEAGTKLTFPMMLMLGVVMVIVMVPAFMSM